MKPTPVSRFYFSQDEVIAALFPSGIPSKSIELRIDGDELVVDFVNPVVVDEAPAEEPERPAQEQEDGSPDDHLSPLEYAQKAKREAAETTTVKTGPNEEEARHLCAQRGFQTFLEVRTEEAALKILLDKCRSPDLRSLDTEKYKKAAFRDIVAEYELWLRG